MAYEQVTGPLGQERDDQLNALAALATASPWTKKGQKLHVDDFLPSWDRKPETPEERKKGLMAWVRQMGGSGG